MKKIIIAGAILAAGAGAYIVTQQNAAPTHNVLEYIPADTPVFAAQLTPFPIKDYIKSSAKMVDPKTPEQLEQLLDANTPGTNFILSLLKSYHASLNDADLFIKTFGLPDKGRSYFYTLGIIPVMKIEIANEQAIWTLLDNAEQESGFSHKQVTLEGITYRAYSLSNADDPANTQIIVAVNNGLLTLTINSSYQDPTLLASALGLSKAKQSLADSGKVEKIINKYHFKDASIGFIDHVELIKGLTTENGNLLAQQFTQFAKQSADNNPLAQMRSAQCASEFATIANNWPRTVGGYTQLDITPEESSIAASLIVESNNSVILTALSDLRGYIPNYTADIDNTVLAMGLGFDVSKLSSSLSTIWGDLQTPSYTCQPLAKIQATMGQANESIAMIGMGANMANGVQGIAASLLDFTISGAEGNPQLDSLDGLFTLSAENPELLFNSAKMFVPQLQNIQLSDQSEPVSLATVWPIPASLNLDPKLAIKGKHLVIYNGKKGQQMAEQLSTEAVTKNGLSTISLDVNKVVSQLVNAAELSGESIPEDMLFLTEYDARMQMSFDINEQGLIFKSKINNRAPK